MPTPKTSDELFIKLVYFKGQADWLVETNDSHWTRRMQLANATLVGTTENGNRVYALPKDSVIIRKKVGPTTDAEKLRRSEMARGLIEKRMANKRARQAKERQEQEALYGKQNDEEL